MCFAEIEICQAGEGCESMFLAPRSILKQNNFVMHSTIEIQSSLSTKTVAFALLMIQPSGMEIQNYDGLQC